MIDEPQVCNCFAKCWCECGCGAIPVDDLPCYDCGANGGWDDWYEED